MPKEKKQKKKLKKYEEFKKDIRKRYEKLEKNVVFENEGKTVYTKSNYSLSKGCQACKSQTWICIYVGFACNARCPFCTQDHASLSESEEVEGFKQEDIVKGIKNDKDITGVSFSGGEPLLYLEKKLLPLAKEIHAQRPDIYLWMYTNGKLIDEKTLKKLKKVGIEEVRINLTATEFDEKIINKIPLIKKIIGKITIEIPSIPLTYEKLIEEKLIHKLVELGVEQLNLAELLHFHPRIKKYLEGEEFYMTREPGAGKKILLTPTRSRNITLSIIEYVIKNKIPLLVNDCSHDAKSLQKKTNLSSIIKK